MKSDRTDHRNGCANRGSAPVHAITRARAVRLALFDVDGVLTDGGLWFGARGEQLKRFHVRDGHGIKLLAAAGVQVAVISGRRSAAIRWRSSAAWSYT
jgi:3-deoxy-D-manno-octulosonate 8-phosphate phosphatase (KDO 8-P phosphatase)